MKDVNEYILQQDESCMDFLRRALAGQVNAKTIKMMDVLLEIIITEMSDSDHSLTLRREVGGIDIIISHSGKAIKDDMMGIIEDQVDRLHYRHLSKDSHTLKISKKIKA